MLDLAGIPLHSAERHGADAAGDRRRHRACTTPSRSPISSTSSVSARGRTSPSSCVDAATGRRGARAGRSANSSVPRSAARRHLCPEPLRRDLQRRRHASPPSRRCDGAPAVGDQAHRPRHGQGVFPDEHHRAQSTEIVHDRVMLELFRGCIRGCRFCQAGYVYRPVREPQHGTCARSTAWSRCDDSGYQEMTLSSLSHQRLPAADGAVRRSLRTSARAAACEPVAAERCGRTTSPWS